MPSSASSLVAEFADLIDVRPRLARLYEEAADSAGLLHTDFCTVRDLLEISGYRNIEPLHPLLLAMLRALAEGSLCVEIAPASLARRLGFLTEPGAADAWAREIVAALAGNDLSALIGDEGATNRPVVRLIQEARTYLYFPKYLTHERELCRLLGQRLGAATADIDPELAGIVREVLDDSPFDLNPDQRLALGLALARDFS